jgi:acetyl-CoA carboxylase biotin carboxylase subunit
MSGVRPIRKILVANRGEIAVRVMRTCREMGIATVAVYSDADAAALHVRMADEAVHIGAAPSAESYLVSDRILEAALKTGADAVHPGYGFLSENHGFARTCHDKGIIFIGPTPEAIEAMGDKTAARALMEKAGVPMAPGTIDAIADPVEAAGTAADIGFPVLIKAAAGGGGKGMRIVRRAEDFAAALATASSEATSAFGDGRVFIEKYIEEPRHIEFQVLADMHGNVVHLFERECSIQRRHQKVVEEAPSCVLTPAIREAMGEAAIRAARSCGYVGAGTVEFLLDKDMRFYFMEMNTRLQVEHPVTEEITGLDLVREQIRVAEGRPLGFAQEACSIHGHAIECRIYAEDPSSGFLPGPGMLLAHDPPSGPGVRVDSGVEEGSEIPIYYDPMVSKLTVWGADREQAMDRMIRALDEYDVAGVPNTIGFCRFVMQHEAFRSGRFSTHFVEQHFSPDVLDELSDQLREDLAIAAALYVDGHHRATTAPSAGAPAAGFSPWRTRRARD